jgi:hypothetical protein
MKRAQGLGRPPTETAPLQPDGKPLSGAVFSLVAISSESGYENWPKANSGHIPCSIGPGMARCGHIEWRTEVAYGHQMAIEFAKKDKM